MIMHIIGIMAEPVWWPAYALLFMLAVIAVIVWLDSFYKNEDLKQRLTTAEYSIRGCIMMDAENGDLDTENGGMSGVKPQERQAVYFDRISLDKGRDAIYGMLATIDILKKNWATSVLADKPELDAYTVGGLIRSLSVLADIANKELNKVEAENEHIH